MALRAASKLSASQRATHRHMDRLKQRHIDLSTAVDHAHELMNGMQAQHIAVANQTLQNLQHMASESRAAQTAMHGLLHEVYSKVEMILNLDLWMAEQLLLVHAAVFYGMFWSIVMLSTAIIGATMLRIQLLLLSIVCFALEYAFVSNLAASTAAAGSSVFTNNEHDIFLTSNLIIRIARTTLLYTSAAVLLKHVLLRHISWTSVLFCHIRYTEDYAQSIEDRHHRTMQHLEWQELRRQRRHSTRGRHSTSRRHRQFLQDVLSGY
jgi:hypothetical protein